MEELKSVLSASGLTISTLPDKGRCLLATKDFSPGDVILSQEPYVSVSSAESRCDSCFTTDNLKRCSACHVVWYCGSTCQKKEWKLHRLECPAFSNLDIERKKLVTPSIRLMVKLCLRRKLQSENVILTSATDNYHLVEALVSHISDIEEKQLVLYAQMANLVNIILQWPQMDLKEIADNFSKLACNAHTICDDELRPLGTGLYPVISIINHSCLPNSVLMFEGKLSVVHAVQHIPKGTEVLISYIETAASSMTRQKALKEQYFFNCACPRCIKVGEYDDVWESAVLEGYRCKDDKCTGFLLRDYDNKGFVCQQCGLIRKKEDIIELASKLKVLSEKVLNLTSTTNYHEAISTHKMIERVQLQLFHPFSITLMRTQESIFKILMELKEWREALVYCRSTIPVYERVYIGFHPLLGLQYYTCGKLEWLLGETEDAIKSLAKAVDILRITHGTNTPFMKELQMKLQEAQAEAHYILSADILEGQD